VNQLLTAASHFLAPCMRLDVFVVQLICCSVSDCLTGFFTKWEVFQFYILVGLGKKFLATNHISVFGLDSNKIFINLLFHSICYYTQKSIAFSWSGKLIWFGNIRLYLCICLFFYTVHR